VLIARNLGRLQGVDVQEAQGLAMPRRWDLEPLKPFAWMALAAFLAGFLSYFAFGDASPATAQAARGPTGAPAETVAASASGAWNLPKHI
jgi:hypothetical protein